MTRFFLKRATSLPKWQARRQYRHQRPSWWGLLVFFAGRGLPMGQICCPGAAFPPGAWGHSQAFSGREVLSSTAILRFGFCKPDKWRFNKFTVFIIQGYFCKGANYPVYMQIVRCLNGLDDLHGVAFSNSMEFRKYSKRFLISRNQIRSKIIFFVVTKAETLCLFPLRFVLTEPKMT